MSLSAPLRRPARFLPVVGAALLLCGCAGLVPLENPLPIPREPSAHGDTRSLAGSPGAAWPSDGWWAEYGDRQLSGLIEEALTGTPDIAAAKARLERARAAASASRSALLPSVDARGKFDLERQSKHYLIPEPAVPQGWNDAGTLSLDVAWEIDFWGKNRAALAAAASEARAAEAEAAAARLLVSSAVASAYAEFARLEAERGAIRDALEVRRRTLSLIEGRVAQSLENDGARDRARSAEAVSRAQLAEVEEQIALSRNHLAALVGAGPDRGLKITSPRPSGARFNALPERVPLDLIGRRPDIAAALMRVEATAARIDVAKAAFYPNINLVGVLGFQSLGVDRLTTPGSIFGSVGPALSLPIFRAGRLVADQTAAEASYAEAVAIYDGSVLRGLRDVADSVAAKRHLRKRLAAMSAAAGSAEKAWTVESDRYKGGLGTYLQVLSAEEALIESRRAMASLRARAFALDIQMIRALGGGYRHKEKAS